MVMSPPARSRWSPGRSNRVLPAEITKRDDSCHQTLIVDNMSRRAGNCTSSPMDARSLPSHAPHAFAYWSRPVRTDVCSMFARMPRYAPAASGIRSESRIPETGQNGSSRHVLALFDSSSRRINEHRSGLLIRGFGVQVPGGAPGLTWGFIAPGHFLCVRFVPMLAPCLLACTDPAIRGLSKTAHPAPDTRTGATGSAPHRPADAAPPPSCLRPHSTRPMV